MRNDLKDLANRRARVYFNQITPALPRRHAGGATNTDIARIG
jgi:hypothetical protein